MLYSSTDSAKDDMDDLVDANSYPPFKVVDSSVVERTLDEIESLGDLDEEGVHSLQDDGYVSCVYVRFLQPHVP